MAQCGLKQHVTCLHTWWTLRHLVQQISTKCKLNCRAYHVWMHLTSDLWYLLSLNEWVNISWMAKKCQHHPAPASVFAATICYPFNAIFTVLSGASCTPSSSKLQTVASLHLVILLVPLFQKGQRTWAPKSQLEKDKFKIMTICTRSLSAILGYFPKCHKVSRLYVFDGKNM